jgi:hypothetical protein
MRLGVGGLVLEISLELGAWNLEFPFGLTFLFGRLLEMDPMAEALWL